MCTYMLGQSFMPIIFFSSPPPPDFYSFCFLNILFIWHTETRDQRKQGWPPDHLSWVNARPLSSQTTHLLRALDWPWCDWYHRDQNNHLEERSKLPQSLVQILIAMGIVFISSTRRQEAWIIPSIILLCQPTQWSSSSKEIFSSVPPSFPASKTNETPLFYSDFSVILNFDSSLNYLWVFLE